MPYEKSSYRPEGLIHSTERGDFVRSKSEVLIANMLYSRNIPYRYEEVLHLGHTTIVPDFTVFIENENRVKLLEHCGLMSNGDYRLRLAEKISIYMDYGYYVGDNLFLTYDEPDGSIDTRRIARIMDAFFV